MLSTVVKWAVATAYGSGSRSDFLRLNLPVMGATWFLLASIIGMLLLHIGLRFKRYAVIFFIICFATGAITARFTWLPFSIQSGMTAAIFFYIGYLGKIKRDNANAKVSLHSKYIICCFFVWGVAIVVSYIDQPMGVSKAFFPNPLINVLGACAATIIVIEISKRISGNHYLSKILEYIGRNSSMVLCFHLIEMNTFPWHWLNGYITMYGFRTCLLLVLKLIWIIGGVFMFRKLKISRLIFS